MYTKDDTSYFIVDAHVALWDARPENQRNVHGKQFIDCFYDYHRNLSPESEVWTYEEYLYQGGDRLMKDLFTDGHDDHAIFQPAILGEFDRKEFRRDRGGLGAGRRSPGQADLQPQLRPAQRRERYGPAARGRRTLRHEGREALHRGMARRVARLAARRPVGVPLLRTCAGNWVFATFTSTRARPSGRLTATHSTSPIDHVASDFTDLNFIVEHCGLPRLEDFCWIATQEPNVHAGLAVAMPFIHTRPQYFAQIVGDVCIGSARTASSSPRTT